MTWTEWNNKIGARLVDRAFAIARREGITPDTPVSVEALIRAARIELSKEQGINPYEEVTI